jgi:hypothetical protein
MSINKRFVVTGIVACAVLAGAWYAHTRSAGENPATLRGSASATARIAQPPDSPVKPTPPELHAENRRSATTPNAPIAANAKNENKTATDTKQPWVDVESQLIHATDTGQQYISGPAFRAVLEDIENAAQSLHAQATGDEALSELNNAYRTAIEEQLAQTNADMNTDLRLSEIACGVQMCIGQIDMASDNLDIWRDWQKKFYDDSRTPHGVFMQYDFPMPDGSIQRRFAFPLDLDLKRIENTDPNGNEAPPSH